MSENSSNQRPRYDPNHFSRALEIVRSILDDQPLSNPVSPSGELYRAIERYHRNMDSRRSLLNPNQDSTSNSNSTPTAPGTPAAAAASRSSIAASMSENQRGPRSSSNTGAAANPREPRDPPSLPPLRYFGPESRRSSVMSDAQADQSFRRRFNHSPLASSLGPREPSSNAQNQDRDRDGTWNPIESFLGPWNLDLEFPPAPPPAPAPPPPRRYSPLDTVNPALILPPAPDDYHHDSRRIKRRKLDSDSLLSGSKAFRYGYYGQVEPGELKMELVSCDGGMYEGEALYPADNILKDDNSVYCTKGNRCNILLRHQGASVFTLKELIIKAPGHDFDAPVRHGFVFVSMTEDEVLNRTANFQIQYKASSARDASPEGQTGSTRERTRGLAADGDSSNEESNHLLTDVFSSGLWLRLPSRRRSFYTYGMTEEDRQHARAFDEVQREEAPEDRGQNRDWLGVPADPESPRLRQPGREAQMPEDFSMRASGFNVTTECSDDEDDGGLGAHSRVRYRRAPNRIGSLPFERIESDSSDDARNPFPSAPYESFDEFVRWRRRERQRRSERTTLTAAESFSNALAEAQEASQVALQEAIMAVGGELLQPLAKFSMEKDKNKCTIRFDPPASARFLLLKIWNPTDDPSGNIDVKAIMVKGFAGPRYFPSVQMR